MVDQVLTRLRTRQEWRFFRALHRAAPGWATAWWVLVVLRGVVPAGVSVAFGWLVDAVDRDASMVGPLVLTGVVFTLSMVLHPLHQLVSANLGSRMADHLYERLMTASVAQPGLGHLEDPDLAGDLAVARDFDLGMTGPPLSISMDFIADGLVQLVIGLAAAAAPVRLHLVGADRARRRRGCRTHWLLRESGVWKDRNTDEVRTAQRDADYAYRLAVDAAAGQGAAPVRPRRLDDRPLRRHAAPGCYDLQYEATTAAREVGAGVPRDRRRRQPGRCSGRSLEPPPTAICSTAACRRVRPGRDRRVGARLRRAELGARRRGGAGGRARTPRGGDRPGRGAADRAEVATWPPSAARSASATSRSPTRRGAAGARRLRPHDPGRHVARDRRRQNGAGKTTLAKLLCRLYDPTAGPIEVDGIDAAPTSTPRRGDATSPRCSRTSSASSCRCATTSRPARRPRRGDQGRARRRPARATWPAATSTRSCRRATPAAPTCRAASGSASRSPGRCAPSRSGPGCVLLDEPTAQLDVRGEAEIFDRVLAATRARTTILISHRFSTVRHADRICVLEAGRVVELGSHDELMALGGRYRTMFDLQASALLPRRRRRPTADARARVRRRRTGGDP